ncbi:MAG: AMP-binding protein [Pseudomonadota bacterium]
MRDGSSSGASLCDFGPPPPCPVRFNLAAHTLAAGPDDKIALTVARAGDDPNPERMTYGDLRRRVMRAAGGLRDLGVAPGDRVMLRIGHSTDFPIFFLAAAALGAAPVPTSTLLSADEARFIAEETEARAILVSEGLALETAPAPQIAPEEAMGAPLDAFADTTADDLAYIVYTSGSSGRPKGVAHAHRAAWARRMMWRGWYGLSGDDVMLHAGAFNWTYTLGAGLMDPWAAGASTLIYAGPRDPGVWPRLAETFGATIFAAAPGVYRQLLKSEAKLVGMKRLSHALSAGETMAAGLRADWNAKVGKPIYEALGMTECSTFISSCPDAPHRAGMAGRPQPGRKVALLPIEGGAIDGSDAPVPRGEAGVISVHRSDPGLMLGYWKRPEDTAATMRGDWFATGDIGVMDADGYIRFEGRGDDQMNALGYRVAPEEVEAALVSHPAVTGAAAVELPVREDLSVIAAFLTCEGEAPDEETLRAHAAEHLASYKTPKIFRILPDLPRNPNGKLRRRDLIAEYGFKPAK